MRTLERFLSALAFRQIEVRADDATDEAVRLTTHRKAAREHVDVVAILVAKPEFHRVVALTAQHAVDDLAHHRSIVGVEQTLPRADVRLDLVSPYPSIFLQCEEYTTAPVSRFQSQTPSCAPANASDSRSSLSRSADSVRLRSVMSRTMTWMARSGGSSNSVPMNLHVPGDAVEPDERLLDCRNGLAHEQLANSFTDVGVTVGLEETKRRLSDDLVASDRTKQPQRGRIDEDDGVVPADEDAVRRQVHQLAIVHRSPRIDPATAHRLC